jgi:hypothetical protein
MIQAHVLIEKGEQQRAQIKEPARILPFVFPKTWNTPRDKSGAGVFRIKVDLGSVRVWLAFSQDVTSDNQTTWEPVAEETIFPAVIVSTASISSKSPAAV